MACVRYCLLLSNFLIGIIGLLLVAGGIWLTVDEASAEETAEDILNNADLQNAVKSIPKLENALAEVVQNNYFRWILIGAGLVTFLIALFGFCGTKKYSLCLLITYSFCVFVVIILQISTIVLINDKSGTIELIKTILKSEAKKIDIDVDNLKAGDKFLQTLFFGVSAFFSFLIFIMTIIMCCRSRREDRVKTYGNPI